MQVSDPRGCLFTAFSLHCLLYRSYMCVAIGKKRSLALKSLENRSCLSWARGG